MFNNNFVCRDFFIINIVWFNILVSKITFAFRSGRIADSTFRFLSQLWKLKQYIELVTPVSHVRLPI